MLSLTLEEGGARQTGQTARPKPAASTCVGPMPLRLVDASLIDAQLLLCEDAEGCSSWRFLDQLPAACGIPSALCDLVRDFTDALHSIILEAAALREAGMLGHHQELEGQLRQLRNQRAECLAASVQPRRRANNSLPCLTRVMQAPSCSWDACTMAAKLHRDHFCVIDGFLLADEAVRLHEHLRSMYTSGELQPGEVSGGLQRDRRGDVMKWVSTTAGAQPAALYALLTAFDGLIGALTHEPLLADDLGSHRMLCRHEMQCTLLPRKWCPIHQACR